MNAMKMLITLAPTILLAAAAPAREPGDGEAAPVALQPGQWEMATEITSFEAPGAPEPLLRQIRAQIVDHRETRLQCMTPEQARNPAHNMMGNQSPADCDFDDTTWTGGFIRVRATCRLPNGPPGRLSLDGTYAAQRIDVQLSMQSEIPNPSGTGQALPLAMQGRMTGRHTGECGGQ